MLGRKVVRDDACGSGDERNLLLPVIYESGSTKCLVGDDDDGIAGRNQESEISKANGRKVVAYPC